MHKIINCSNLIGDSLYILKPVRKYLDTFGGECLGLIVLPGLGGDIVKACFKDVRIFDSEAAAKEEFPTAEILQLTAGRAMEHAYNFHQKNHTVAHISECFAYMLGVDLGDDIIPPLDWIPPYEGPREDVAIIAPFSRSCMRHSTGIPNKTLDDWKWEYIVRFLRRHGLNVQCTGAKDDLLTLISLPISSYRSGESLWDILRMFQKAKLVISIDNGMAHLASACRTPTIVLWPGQLPPRFIAPTWQETTAYILIGKVSEAAPSSILYGIKTMLNKMEQQHFLEI